MNNPIYAVDKTITLPLSDAAKEDVEKSNTSNAEDSNPFELNEKPLVENKDDQEATNEEDPKKEEGAG